VLRVEVPPRVPARCATFAQQELRKLDATLGPEADLALAQLIAVGPDRLAETRQRVFDHDAVLVLECVGEAVASTGQFDDALRDRYGATLAVLDARRAKIADGLALARAAEAKTS
jgi:hypothetical protein